MRKFKSSIGSTNVTNSQFLVDYDTEATEPIAKGDLSVDSTDILDDLYAKSTKGNIHIDDIMFSADHASKTKHIDSSYLSKIWRINLDCANRTLKVTSQHSTRSNNRTLSRNYGTNDRMRWYKRIKEHFFMDTFFQQRRQSSIHEAACAANYLSQTRDLSMLPPLKVNHNFSKR